MKVVVLTLLLLAVGGSAVHCPDGWFTYLNNQTSQTAECYKLFLNKASPIDTEFFCSSVVAGETYTSAHSASVKAVEEVLSLQSLLSPMCEYNVSTVASVGGVHMYGEYHWFDGTPFAISTPDDLGEGCLTLSCDGSWGAISCTDTKLPFFCRAIVQAPTPSPTTAPTTTTTPAPGSPTTPTTAPPPIRPARPVATANRTCPSGWTHSHTTGACYRYLPKLVEGLQADAACMDAFPTAHMVSIYDEDDSAAVTNLLPTSTTALVGGVFMDGGLIGVVWEDYAWYTPEELAAASPSTPTWPTPSNGFYQAWAPSEPRLDFGCISINRDGKWVAVSCRDPMPVVCSFMAEEFYPTTTSAAPTELPTTTGVPGASCTEGWSFVTSAARCVKVVGIDVRGRDMDMVCAGAASIASPSASPLLSTNMGLAIASLVGLANNTEALLGLTFIGYGEDGYVTDGSYEWSSVKAVVNSLWAPSEPMLEMGCIVITPQGTTRAVACTSTVQAVVCQYDPSTLTTTAPPTQTTTTPTTLPTEGPLTISSLEGRTHIEVTLNTIGTYEVDANRNASRAVLWFSHGGVCNGVPPSLYLAVVMSNGVVRVKHLFPTNNGVVCVSVDGSSFVPTNITFVVIDAIVDGIVHVDGDMTDPYLISRLSSSHFTLTGRNSSLIAGVRYSSVEGCNNPPFSFGPGFMKVNNWGAYGYDVIDYARYHSRQFMVVPEYLTSFYVCVSLKEGGVFTLVPSLYIEVAEEEVVVTAANVGLGDTTDIVLAQYDLPTIRLVGTGIQKGFIAGFAGEGGCITSMDRATAIPITVLEEKDTPILVVNFNHTAYPTSSPLTLCIASHPYLTPRPTHVRVTVTPTTVTGLSTSPHQPGTPLTVLTEGYQGVLYMAGLEGLAATTLSTMRVGFAPRVASNVASGLCNASSFYGGRAFSLVPVGGQVGIALPRGFIKEGLSVYHALCFSVGHGLPSKRVFLLSSALIDIRPLSVLRVGAAPVVSPTVPYPTLLICDQLTNLVLPVVGYGLQGGMSALLSPNPCVTTDEVGVEVPLRTDYTDPLKGPIIDGSVYLGFNASHISMWKARYGSQAAWLCIKDPVLGTKFTPFQFQLAPPSVSNISTAPLVYGEAVSVLVSGFGLDVGTAVSLGVSGNCANLAEYVILPVLLSKTPPSDIADFEFVSSPLTSQQSLFVSFTALQTASLTVTGSNIITYCACVAGVCNTTGIPVDRRVPSILGFEVLSAIKQQVYIDSDEDTEPLPVNLVGPLVYANPHTLVVHFVYKAANCGNMTDADAPFSTKATLGEVLVFPDSLPEGEFRVCFTIRSTTPVRYAALDFGLTAILQPATTSLFSINGSTSVVLHPGVERLLPVDGSGIRQSSVLRLSPAGARCESTLPDLPLHRVDGVWYVYFSEAHTTSNVGSQVVCLKGHTTGAWEELRIQIKVEPTREALWFTYFPADPVISAEPQLPAVFQPFPGRAILNTVGSTDLVAKLKCGGVSCPSVSRLIFVRVDSANKDTPCAFGQNEDLQPENVAGPFTTFNSILVLSAARAKEWSGVIGYQSNWTMCVEGAPSFWIRPASPISLAFAPLSIWSVTYGGQDTTNIVVEAGSEAARMALNGLGIEEGATVRFGAGCVATQEDAESSYIAANPRLVNTTFTLFGIGMVIDGSLLEQAELEPIPLCVARPSSTNYIMTNITIMVVAPKDPSIPEVVPEPLLSVPVNATGTVYLSEYGVVNIPVGSAVMLSTACYYNSHGLPLMTVVGSGAIHLLAAHTAIPTSTSLEICLRKLATSGDIFTTPFFQATGVRFGVVNITVVVSDAVTVARNVHESVVLSVHISGDGGLVPTQVLPYYGSLKLSIHAPCGDAHHFPPLYSQRLVDQTISQVGGSINGSAAGTLIAVVEGSAYTVLSPASVCVSVDGGRQYFTTNVAYFEVDWSNTLELVNSGRSTEVTTQSLGAFTFFDSRLGGTSTMAMAAQAALWSDCISEEGVVLTGSSIVIPALLPVGTFSLSVTCGRFPPVYTGINISVSELAFQCSGLIAVGPSDVGRLVSEDICIPKSMSVTAARYADSCTGPSWAGLGSVVNGTVVVPLAVAFADASLNVCPRVFCAGDCADTGEEARYVSSDMSAVLVDITTTIEIDGIANGIVVLHYGVSHMVTVTTGGMDEANMLLSFLPKGSDDCNAARPEDVVDVAEGFANVSRSILTEVSNSEADARRVCYSNDGGANYLPVGTSGLWVVVAPVRAVGVQITGGSLVEEVMIAPKGATQLTSSDSLIPPRVVQPVDGVSVGWSGSVQESKTVIAVSPSIGCSGKASYTFAADVGGALTLVSGSYPTVVPSAPYVLCTLNNGVYYGPEWGTFLTGKQLSCEPHLTTVTLRFGSTIGSTRTDDSMLVLDSAAVPSSSDVRLWVASELQISPAYVQVVVLKGPTFSSNVTITRVAIKVNPTPTLPDPLVSYTSITSLVTEGSTALPMVLRVTERTSSGSTVGDSISDLVTLGVLDVTAAEKTVESSWGWSSVPVLLLLPAFLLFITVRVYYWYFDVGTMERLEAERNDEEAAISRRQELRCGTISN